MSSYAEQSSAVYFGLGETMRELVDQVHAATRIVLGRIAAYGEANAMLFTPAESFVTLRQGKEDSTESGGEDDGGDANGPEITESKEPEPRINNAHEEDLPEEPFGTTRFDI